MKKVNESSTKTLGFKATQACFKEYMVHILLHVSSKCNAQQSESLFLMFEIAERSRTRQFKHTRGGFTNADGASRL